MEWFIKKNATLPILKVKLSQNGRSDFMNTMSVLNDSQVYFSMIDVETNIPKISSVSATVESGLTEDGQIEYFTYYQFKKNQTKKTGRFSAQFMVKNSDGVLYLPSSNQLFINIIDSFSLDETGFDDNYVIEFPCCPDNVRPDKLTKYLSTQDSFKLVTNQGFSATTKYIITLNT
jgi:hypothetical protein